MSDCYRLVVDVRPKDDDLSIKDLLNAKQMKEVTESVLTTVRASLPPEFTRQLVVPRRNPLNEHFHLHPYGNCNYYCTTLGGADG